MAKLGTGPVETLMAEHRVIEAVLGCMERMAGRIEEGGADDVLSARRALTFMGEFADRLHHEKEEAILFPALGRLGICSSNRPFVMMCHEHEMGRAHLRRMAKFLDAWSAGGPDGAGAALAFAGDCRSYVSLLREHIAREDEQLFPEILRQIASDDLDALAAAFAEAESGRFGLDVRERMTELAADLLARWPATEPSTPPD